MCRFYRKTKSTGLFPLRRKPKLVLSRMPDLRGLVVIGGRARCGCPVCQVVEETSPVSAHSSRRCSYSFPLTYPYCAVLSHKFASCVTGARATGPAGTVGETERLETLQVTTASLPTRLHHQSALPHHHNSQSAHPQSVTLACCYHHVLVSICCDLPRVLLFLRLTPTRSSRPRPAIVWDSLENQSQHSSGSVAAFYPVSIFLTNTSTSIRDPLLFTLRKKCRDAG